jgi:hypothetical protein
MHGSKEPEKQYSTAPWLFDVVSLQTKQHGWIHIRVCKAAAWPCACQQMGRTCTWVVWVSSQRWLLLTGKALVACVITCDCEGAVAKGRCICELPLHKVFKLPLITQTASPLSMLYCPNAMLQVANKRNGVDVDKFDYLKRDSMMCGVGVPLDARRLMLFSRLSPARDMVRCKDDTQLAEVFVQASQGCRLLRALGAAQCQGVGGGGCQLHAT